MNAPEMTAEVRFRQASCRATAFAALAGFSGKLATERGHLEARLDAAVRRFAANHTEENRVAMHAANAALERFEERTAPEG